MWRGVEFWPFPLTCFVAFKTHTRTTVRVCDRNEARRVHAADNHRVCMFDAFGVRTFVYNCRALTENAGHEFAGHNIARHDKYRAMA